MAGRLEYMAVGGRVAWFFAECYTRQDIDAQGTSMAHAYGNTVGFNLGVSLKLSEAWRLGSAIGYYQQDLDAGAADSDYSMHGYLASFFGQYQQNRWWGDFAITGGSLTYDDLERSFYLGQLKRTKRGDTKGTLWASSARIGYHIAPQAESFWHLSPFISADYAQIKVNGFTEEGALLCPVHCTLMSINVIRRD